MIKEETLRKPEIKDIFKAGLILDILLLEHHSSTKVMSEGVLNLQNLLHLIFSDKGLSST